MNAEQSLSDKSKSLPTGRERELWQALNANADAKAREALFSIYMPLAKRIARRHFLDRKSGDIELPDLCQMAYAGLLESIDRFDPAFGASFRSFAYPRVSGSVLDGIAKISERREQLSFRNRIRIERAKSLGAKLEAEKDPMQAFIDLAVGLALGFMLEGTGLYAAEGQVDPRADAYESFSWKEAVERVQVEVSGLPEREELVIRMHYLNGMEFEQIGDLLDLSKGRISQLHKTAIGLLRKRLSKAASFRLTR